MTKVIMVCDRIYVEKADARRGGVGAESQIISPELYGKSQQDKFAAVIREVDSEGQPFVPIFYKGRIHFDLSNDERYETQYEELLRWLLGKPQRIKPPLGAIPRHIADPSHQPIVTESRFRRADEAVRINAPTSAGLIREFCDALVVEFGNLKLQKQENVERDDEVVTSIEAARPYVFQVLTLASSIIKFSSDTRAIDTLHALVEQLGNLMFRPEDVSQWNPRDFDGYRFLCHEIFLGIIAIALREDRFDVTDRMLSRPYLVNKEHRGDRATDSFGVFQQEIASFEHRNRRLSLGRSSLQADFLKKFHTSGIPNFDDLMQADFVLYLRFMATKKGQTFDSWYPVTLVYAASRYRPFPIFARSESRDYFQRICGTIGIPELGEFKQLVTTLTEGERFVPRYDWNVLPVERLSNINQIATVD